ncbi:MAG: PLDc N-terminal domain-containing protein [Candidatus Dormiibacterota bacterium]
MLAGAALAAATASGSQFVLLFAPLALINLGLVIYSLLDLSRRGHVTGGHKWPWVVVILVVGTIGPIVYLVVGRREG